MSGQSTKIKFLGETLPPISALGILNHTIPLPISSGRGFAPNLSLDYSSMAGRSEFGMGWNVTVTSIKRKSKLVTPKYSDNDEFVGPDGEVIFPEVDEEGNKVTRESKEFRGKTLDKIFLVTRYFPRVENKFSLFEKWDSKNDESINDGNSFWLIHLADGTLHCLGKTQQARLEISDEGIRKTAEWLLEESVSSNCDHIYYEYSTSSFSEENNTNRNSQVYKYLKQVYYSYFEGNRNLLLFQNEEYSNINNWNCILQFDYGDTNLDPSNIIPFQKENYNWKQRSDSYSEYRYGFEVRINCLCRQVLMYHNFTELGDEPVLIARLILGYDENSLNSTLRSARLHRYGDDEFIENQSPIDFNYNDFKILNTNSSPNSIPSHFTEFNSPMTALRSTLYYKLIDLYGDGVPGLLSKIGNSFYYCAPQRKFDLQNRDAIGYSEPKLLHTFPTLQRNSTRTVPIFDINGDGILEYFVTNGTSAGYFPFKQDGNISNFVQMNSFPTEALYHNFQWIDITQNGIPDLVNITPNYVRYYPNKGKDGFDTAVDVPYLEGGSLPTTQLGSNNIVIISNFISSNGGFDIVEICYNKVTCWPSLGYGKFGKPVILPISITQDEMSFDPARVHVADLDRSGLSDIIYFESDGIKIFLNLSGNKFSESIFVPFPSGVRYDNISNVNFADIFGNGSTSLIFTATQSDEKHYIFSFSDGKSYLLNNINTNIGFDIQIKYRSSVQFWLDEKVEHPNIVSKMPLAFQVVEKLIITDEIRNTKFQKSYTYNYGYYDYIEKEFNGYGRVTFKDSELNENSDLSENTPPLVTINWYHTGIINNENLNYFTSDYFKDEKINLNTNTLLTIFDDNKDIELSSSTDDETIRQLHRCLKGKTLRTETYALSQSGDLNKLPHIVTINRYTVRLQEKKLANTKYCVVLPSILETINCVYEQVLEDPIISHNILLTRDFFGSSLQEVIINYPRFITEEFSSYFNQKIIPSAVVENKTTWKSSFDDSQYVLRIKEIKQNFIYTSEEDKTNGYWKLFTPYELRQDLIEIPSNLSMNLLNFESLKALNKDNPLLHENKFILSQLKNIYSTAVKPESFYTLITHNETLEFDKTPYEIFKNSGKNEIPYDDFLQSKEKFEAKLKSIGYKQGALLFTSDVSNAQNICWVAERNFSEYADENRFFVLLKQKSSCITDWDEYYYDDFFYKVKKLKNALSNESLFSYCYRTFSLKETTDINSNKFKYLLDATGRTIASSYFGHENDKLVGFSQSFDTEKIKKIKISEMISAPISALTNDLENKKYYLSLTKFNDKSWMGQLSESQINTLKSNCIWQEILEKYFVTEEGYIRSNGHRLLNLENISIHTKYEDFIKMLKEIVQIPVHQVAILSDEFEPLLPQVKVSYVDGFGDTIQVCSKAPEGDCFKLDESLSIQKLDEKDSPVVEKNSKNRWLVSSKTIYNNKKLVAQEYNPFFLNTYFYIKNLNPEGWNKPTSYYYDPFGRLEKKVDSSGFIERITYYTWAKIYEDKNDTYCDTLIISGSTSNI